jgi:N-acetyl-gamma-glutamylphosphate reductase
MFHKLQDGALLIADAHYPNHKKEQFLALLQDIKEGKIRAKQLILMGDIFAAKNDKCLFVSSAIDNLLRGASSQAVVAANLMMNLDQDLGIPKIAYVP